MSVEAAGIAPVSDAELGEYAPIWVPDNRATMCQKCSENFTKLNRRHHCRACGQVVCASCSSSQAPLKYTGYDSKRVCDTCYEVLLKAYGHQEHLRNRFKAKDGKSVKKRIPDRLKVADMDDSQMSGYLSRRSQNGKWKKSWFILKDRVLFICGAPGDIKAIETIPVLGWNLEQYSDKNMELYEALQPSQVWELKCGSGSALQRHIFSAENDNLAEKWIAALREAMNPELCR